MRNKSRVSLAQIVQQNQKRPSLQNATAQSPRGIQKSKQYDPAVAVAAQSLLDKFVVQSGRTSKASTTATKKQPLTSKKKTPTTAVINLLENRKPLFIEECSKTMVKDKAPTQQSGQDQEGPHLPETSAELFSRD